MWHSQCEWELHESVILFFYFSAFIYTSLDFVNSECNQFELGTLTTLKNSLNLHTQHIKNNGKKHATKSNKYRARSLECGSLFFRICNQYEILNRRKANSNCFFHLIVVKKNNNCELSVCVLNEQPNSSKPNLVCICCNCFFSLEHYVSLLLVVVCANNGFCSEKNQIFLFFTERVEVSNETNSLFKAILMFLYDYFTLS